MLRVIFQYLWRSVNEKYQPCCCLLLSIPLTTFLLFYLCSYLLGQNIVQTFDWLKNNYLLAIHQWEGLIHLAFSLFYLPEEQVYSAQCTEQSSKQSCKAVQHSGGGWARAVCPVSSSAFCYVRSRHAHTPLVNYLLTKFQSLTRDATSPLTGIMEWT